MHRLRRGLLVQALMALDAAAAAGALAAAWWAGEAAGGAFWSARIPLRDGILAAAWLAAAHGIFRAWGLYRSYRLGSAQDLYRRVAAATAVSAVLLGAGGLGCARAALFWVLAAAGIGGARAILYGLLQVLRRKGRNLRYILIVGAGRRGRKLAAELESRLELGCRVVGFLDEGSQAQQAGERLLGGFGDLERILRARPVDEVVLALPLKSFYQRAAHIVEACEERGVVVRVAGDLFDARRSRLEAEQVEELSLLTLFTGRGSALAHALKRAADAIVSAAALVALAPAMALIALAIKLDSPGPVLFRQVRVGQNGRRFRMWKFRSMTADAEARLPELEARNEVRGAAFKIRDDPRVTRVGRWLRRTSLDELPQLLNVLRGEMSLVGPRPLPERDVEQMNHDWQRRRFSVRPGLTGLWQAGGRHRIGFEEWMRMDLDYIDNWSLLLDLKILLRTLPAVWSGVGAS